MGNILIDIDTGDGFLNDWDLCKYGSEMNHTASQHSRSVGDITLCITRKSLTATAGNMAVYVSNSD